LLRGRAADPADARIMHRSGSGKSRIWMLAARLITGTQYGQGQAPKSPTPQVGPRRGVSRSPLHFLPGSRSEIIRENTNDLLRQYFRKGMDLSTVEPAEVRLAADEINGRPRAFLDGDSATVRWFPSTRWLRLRPRRSPLALKARFRCP
jgi:hypothetical protein